MKKKQPPGAKAPSKPQVETEGDADNEQMIPECLSRARGYLSLNEVLLKDDMKSGTSQARLNEDEAVRVAYKHGTPLEGGKIGDSEPVDLFSSPHYIPK
ncbi:hypothetical protein L3X38_006700 [Prunus dulcis]|uniref:Uncharacterized protein n=1 Tax=Prunus dulcis TaxID=3755 RepID=A0AAD5F582_PRUDU|nr:hypothetical protein L3X38_006700 [Prunus dulcis]